VWDLFKYPKMNVSIVDALIRQGDICMMLTFIIIFFFLYKKEGNIQRQKNNKIKQIFLNMHASLKNVVKQVMEMKNIFC